MTQRPRSTRGRRKPAPTEPSPRHRSGAVARMLGMPVATLRVWERRYGLTQPELSPSGQRLYTDDDMRRLALIRQLTERGHAIGSLAPLDMAQLQRVAATHAQTLAATRAVEPPEAARPAPTTAWRVAVIGHALGARLRRPALLRRLDRPIELLGPFDDATRAAAALRRARVDAVLMHLPQLQADSLSPLDSVPALATARKGVLYGFAADTVCDALAAAGVALLREPQPDAVLAPWLQGLSAASARRAAKSPARSAERPPPRRWDDAALADFAGRASVTACECPRHVAELLVQLAQFEAYSAACGHRNASDAGLHAFLGQVAAGARARFEVALERVALHEGLLLPASRAVLPL